MIPEGWIHYKVEIIQESYIEEDKVIAPHTALLSFYNKNGNVAGQLRKGYFKKEEIFEKIKNKEPLILNSCYIDNFSMSEYRHKNGMPEDALVDVNGISANESVFDALILNDFSYSRVHDRHISFKNSVFIHGHTSFLGSVFELGNVNFSHCRFIDGDFDFSQCDLGEGGAVFNSAVFGEGFKDFHYTKFGDRDVSFVATSFGKGDVSFINASFGNVDVSFARAEFGEGLIDFHFIHFHVGTINFERTIFGSGKVDFHMIEFDNCKVNFNRAEFGDGDLNFDACTMKEGKIQFKHTFFGDGLLDFENLQMKNCDLLFDKAVFGKGNMSLCKSEFRTLSLKSCQLNSYLDLRIAHADILDLTDTIVRDVVDMIPYDFDVDIKKMDVTGMRLLGQINIYWNENRLKEILESNKEADYRSLAEQFRIFKQNFNKTGRYDDEDRAYIEFKRNESKASLEQGLKKSSWSAIWRYPAYYLKYVIFDSMGLYATSPFRVLVSVVVSYMFIVLIQILLPFFFETSIGSCISETAPFWERFWGTFYFSGVTFFTIGYGDCSPVGVLRYVSDIEGFVGVFMMSYFTVAFARKVLR